MSHEQDSLLGKETIYPKTYTPELLFPIPRTDGRMRIGIVSWDYFGEDVWTAYELSWLNPKGKPQVAIGRLRFPCHSPNLIESKSLKLYFNSFNQTHFVDWEQCAKQITQDLSRACGASVGVELVSLEEGTAFQPSRLEGMCLDSLDIAINRYHPDPSVLRVGDACVEETLYSHLFRSNCPVTGQPDWATILVSYDGKRIDHEALLRYLISFREHQAFHEQCIEEIFCALMSRCQPEKLTVAGFFTRRGGLDINPIRSTEEEASSLIRIIRQ